MGKVALWVTCRHCGQTFDTGVRMDERSFRRGTLAVNYHTCPRCGIRQTYGKDAYDLREAPTGPGAPRKEE